MRALVRIEALVTQLVFEHALRMRVKAETGTSPADGKAAEGRNVQGKINNLITSDLAAIGFGREILAPCSQTFPNRTRVLTHRSSCSSPQVADAAHWLHCLSVRASRLEVSAPVASIIPRTEIMAQRQCSSGHERGNHPAPIAWYPRNPSS